MFVGWISEMRELDSERQSLVYNHHHELIAASDTIAAVSPVPAGRHEALRFLREDRVADATGI